MNRSIPDKFLLFMMGAALGVALGILIFAASSCSVEIKEEPETWEELIYPHDTGS